MFVKIIGVLFLSLCFTSCSTNPVTGRSQLKLLPESELRSMADQQYRQFLSSNHVITTASGGTGAAEAEMVRRVGSRVAEAVTRYFQQKGLADQLKDYQWEFNLVDNKEANAWCMPGGKVVVYSGILPLTKNDNALAIVLGHEISHAILQHGNERMSQQLGAEAVGAGLQVAMSQKPQETQTAFLTAFGVGTQLGVLLPFSRKQESEADHYGLLWAAMACYDPREAIPFWNRMQAAAGGSQPPVFLSDHPATTERIQQLQQEMPEAMRYYSQCK